MIIRNRKKIYYLLLFLAVISSLFFVSFDASAQCTPEDYGENCDPMSYSGAIESGGGSSGLSCFFGIESCLNWVREVMANLIAWVGSLIDPALRIDVTNIEVVREGWSIALNFANMFFIVALIIMAFGTIFSISKYDYRRLIINFLVAALLVNFSLVIGQIIIDWSQSLSNIFLGAIGNVGDRLGQGAEFGQQFKDSSANLGIVNGGIAVVANIILLSIVLFSMIVLLFFSIVRIPILWALLIISPIAWILYILPTTEKYSRMWWNHFISWNLFMPIYLFFIYFGVMFLSKQEQVIANGAPSIIPGLNEAGGLQTVFFYILIGLFLIYGAKAAMGFSSAGGAGAVAGWAWAKGRTAARFTGVGLSRRAPGIKEIEPAYKAAGQKMAQYQKDTERKLQQAQSKYGARFGVKGVSEQQFSKDTDNALQELKDKKVYDTSEKLAKVIDNSNSTSAQKVAAYKLLKEFHQEEGNAEQIKTVANAFREEGLTAQESKFMASIDFNKLSSADIEKLMNDEFFTGASVSYHKQFKDKITDARIKKGVSDADQLATLLGNYTNDEDITGALKKVDKDTLDGFSKDENRKLYEYLRGKQMKDSQKIIALTMLKKGQFDTKDMQEIFGKYDTQTKQMAGGIYESPLEQERALKVAEEKRLFTVLKIREQVGMLDKNEDGTRKTIQEVIQSRASRFNNEDLLKIRAEEYAGPNAELFMDELEKVLKRSPKRIASIVGSTNYTGKHEEIFDARFKKIHEQIMAEGLANAKARRATREASANASSAKGGGRPAPAQHLGGPTVIVPPEAAFKLEKERTQAKSSEEEKIKSIIATQGFIGFKIKESADQFREKHLDWTETKTGDEWQFKPPKNPK